MRRIHSGFNGGDCLNSNNIQDPNIFTCEDFFDGPPAADDFGAEAYMVIADIKGEGVIYFDGIVKVGDVFNITNILPDSVIIPNVNVTIYEGACASENIRETMIIHTSCSQVTFLKDRYGVLELIGFLNPSSQGYLWNSMSVMRPCLIMESSSDTPSIGTDFFRFRKESF